jgi:Fic family protein
MLEGNPYTLPEVQTLIDGFTVGGHTRQDTDQVLDILEAYEELTRLLEEGEFIPSVQVSNALNGLVTRHELIKPGMLRGADGWPGTVHVNLAGAGNYEAPDSGDSGERLQAIHQRIVDECAAMDDARLASAHYFCQAVLAQFYRDGNKRTSRMVANGMLVDAGWDAIFIPAKERLHYNELLIDLFTTGDETGLTNLFLALGNQIPG